MSHDFGVRKKSCFSNLQLKRFVEMRQRKRTSREIVCCTVTDPGFGQGGSSSDLPGKCVIWASEYNLGPQKWGGGKGGPGPRPLDPLLL